MKIRIIETAAFATVVILALVEAAATKFPFPAPTGKFKIGTVELQLVDHNRTDPYAPATEDRALMVQLFYPTKRTEGFSFAAYMPKGVAELESQSLQLPNNTLGEFKIRAYGGAPISSPNLPMVVFSPGLGVSRCFYASLLSDIASRGYLVVSVDHTYDADVVEFPDGRLVRGVFVNPTLAEIEQAMVVRTQDISFVLDALNTSSVSRLIPGLKKRLNTRKVVMIGHSLGGATSAALMLTDSRVIGGANFDGSFWGPVLEQGLDRPFFMMRSSQDASVRDETWSKLWPKLRSRHYGLQLADSGHMTFSDAPIQAKALNITSPDLIPILGAIDGVRAMELQRTYIAAFISSIFHHKVDPILLRPDAKYPEISFRH